MNRKYPHSITAYSYSEESDNWSPSVYSGVRVEEVSGSYRAVNGNASSRSIRVFIPATNNVVPPKEGDVIIKGIVTECSELKNHPNAHVVQAIKLLSRANNKPHHYEVSGL